MKAAWSHIFAGTKSEILAQLKKWAGEAFYAAIVALMELHDEVPGWGDKDPAETWAKDVPHTDADIPPLKRSELWKTSWKVTTSGNPDAHGVTEVRIEPVYEAVK